MIIAMGCGGIRDIAEEPAKEIEPLTVTGFRATGHEPFWELEIEFDNLLKFSSLTDRYPELTFHMPDPDMPGNLSLVKYSAKTYNAEAEVAISREECKDTMKGDLFPYTVTISVRRNHFDQYTVFRGCGRYLGTYRLNDIWILKKIDSDPIDIPDSRKYPRLEVDLSGKTITGYGGCNKFHGRAELVNNNLVTGNIISTRMACIDTQEIENRFLETLSGKTLEFSIIEDTMKMTDGETELIFRRAGQQN